MWNPFTNVIYLANSYLCIKTLRRHNSSLKPSLISSSKSFSLPYYLSTLYIDIIRSFYLLNAYFVPEMMKQRLLRNSKVVYLSHKIKARSRIIIKACLISKSMVAYYHILPPISACIICSYRTT